MITLSIGEEVISSGEAKWSGTKGILYCTNNRIAFEYQSGIIFVSKSVPVDIPLLAISSVTIEGLSFLKKLVINIRKGVIPGSARYEFNVRDPPQWEARIQMAVSGSSPYNVPELKTPTLKPTTVQAKRCLKCGQLVEWYMAYCPVCANQQV